jgi:hypothetical protein
MVRIFSVNRIIVVAHTREELSSSSSNWLILDISYPRDGFGMIASTNREASTSNNPPSPISIPSQVVSGTLLEKDRVAG